MIARRARPPAEGGRRPAVLQSVRQPSPRTNPYVVQLVESLSAGADVRYFTWRQALCGRYDVVHLHWPEVMLRRDGRAARLLARIRFLALLARLGSSRRTAVVQTLHNLRSHEGGDRLERVLLAALHRRTDHWIALNADTPCPDPRRVTVIPHGDYRDWFAPYPVPAAQPGRLLCFGLIRPYKGVETLLSAFAGLADAAARLRVVGSPSRPELAARVERACRADRRVSARLEYVDDATLADEIGRSQLVVLPYAQMHNSGALLLALSLGRPVLVPDTPVNRQLAREVGPGWVLTYPRALTTAALAGALAEVTAGPPVAAADLSRRRWPLIARQHLDCYRRALARASRSRDPSWEGRPTSAGSHTLPQRPTPRG
jgi:beta-1,4-mannosyltransferase